MEEEIEYTIRVYRYYFRIYRDRRFSIIVFNFVNKKFNEGKERERDMRERERESMMIKSSFVRCRRRGN